MPDLFDHALQERMQSEAPLAARMRPRTLEEFIGQEHIVGGGKLLRRAIEADIALLIQLITIKFKKAMEHQSSPSPL